MRSTSKFRLLLVGLWLVVTSASAGTTASGKESPPGPGGVSSTVEQLNLPSSFRQLIRDRKTIDEFQSRFYQVEPGTPPKPVRPRMRRSRTPEVFQLIESVQPEATARLRAGLGSAFVPRRGFRAPILDVSTGRLAVIEQTNIRSPENSRAANLVNDRLAYDGLLKTLAGVLERLGADRFVTNGRAGLAQLNAVGLPDDLLACFASGNFSDPVEASLEVVQSIAQALTEGSDTRTLDYEIAARHFHFPAAWTGFEVAAETGIHAIGLLRMQAGGGFADGIVSGGGLDVIGQLVSALPQADFMVSIPAGLTAPLSQWADQMLKLNRRHQMTLVAESSPVESWAQDNGKAGTARNPITGRRVLATLTPRYASRLEGLSAFLPGESFLMDGLRATGHRVIHSPLLFQGGNLLAVDDPRSGRRVLLVGEGALHRNVALGLSIDQVKEAFCRGFDVDECVVLPGVSYHLDFDVSIREIDGKLTAFVNDPMAAVRVILKLGVETLAQHGLIEEETVGVLRQDLIEGDGMLAHKKLSALVRDKIGTDGRYGAAMAAMFKSARFDLAEGNLRVFLQALDLLASSAISADDTAMDPERRDYLLALHRMEERRSRQLAALRLTGFEIKLVPSMPDLNRSINYLNGIQHREGYFLPVFGGFYSPLDKLAEQAFRSAIGTQAVIRRIQCADLQRAHGAVHCAAAAYPRLGFDSNSNKFFKPTP